MSQKAIDFLSKFFEGFVVFQYVGECPKAKSNSVVVHMQINKAVAFNIRLCLALFLHEFNSSSHICREIRPGQKLTGIRTHQKLIQSLGAFRKETKWKTEP